VSAGGRRALAGAGGLHIIFHVEPLFLVTNSPPKPLSSSVIDALAIHPALPASCCLINSNRCNFFITQLAS
jgi:hypothetical protein